MAYVAKVNRIVEIWYSHRIAECSLKLKFLIHVFWRHDIIYETASGWRQMFSEFFCRKSFVLLVTLTPGMCAYEIDPAISDTSQQEQWSI